MIRIVKYEPQWVQQAIKEGKKPFFVQMPIKHDHKQGVTTITGLGTAVERSRTGHKMMQKFVTKLKETSKDKPLFVNHDPNQIAGLVTGVKQSKADEIHPIAKLRTPNQNQIVDAPRANVESLIQDKIPIGMSFGGTADDVKIVKEDNGDITYQVHDGELMEWSITPINAVKRSDNSVQNADCPGGICQQIADQIRDGPYLPEINEINSLNITQDAGGNDESDTDENSTTCPQCDATVDDDSTYCPNCGSELTDGDTDQSIGGNNMVESQEIKDLKQMVTDLAGVVKQNNDTIMTMQKAESDRLAEEERLKQEAKVKAEKEQLISDVTEANAEILGEILGPILKSRQGLGQASLNLPNMVNQDATANPVDMANMTPEQIQQFVAQQSAANEKPNFRDSVKYPAVWMGQAIKGGKTPAQMFGAEPKFM